MKKQLNQKPYRLHLSLANLWGNTWHYIQSTIEEKLKKIIQSKYKNLDDKLYRLSQKQKTNTRKATELLSQSH
jgi:hypothetical protein